MVIPSYKAADDLINKTTRSPKLNHSVTLLSTASYDLTRETHMLRYRILWTSHRPPYLTASVSTPLALPFRYLVSRLNPDQATDTAWRLCNPCLGTSRNDANSWLDIELPWISSCFHLGNWLEDTRRVVSHLKHSKWNKLATGASSQDTGKYEIKIIGIETIRLVKTQE